MATSARELVLANLFDNSARLRSQTLREGRSNDVDIASDIECLCQLSNSVPPAPQNSPALKSREVVRSNNLKTGSTVDCHATS